MSGQESMPAKSERVNTESGGDLLQDQIVQAVESHLRRLVVCLLELHDDPGGAAAAATALSAAQAVASALLAVDLDALADAARAIAETLEPLAASGRPVPPGAVVALLDATAGLRAVVAAHGGADRAAPDPSTLDRELAALAPWRSPLGLVAPTGAARRGAAAVWPGPPPAAAGGSTGPDRGADPTVGDDPRDRLRVVPTIDLRYAADRLEASLANPGALAELLAGLSSLADVLARTTATLNIRLAELAELPELAELQAAVGALSRAAVSSPQAGTAEATARPPATRAKDSTAARREG